MRKAITIIGMFILIVAVKTAPAQPQPPDTLWTRIYGGVDSDRGNAIVQTSDGGFLIVGETLSFGSGSSDLYILRTDQNGDTLWTQTYGDIRPDYAYDVKITADNGFIISGKKSFSGYDKRILLLKLDSSGIFQWERTYLYGNNDSGSSVRQLSDGGYAIGGSTHRWSDDYPDLVLVRTDSLGNELWHRTYGSSGVDYCGGMDNTSDNGFILTGLTSYGAGYYDVYLVKTDSLGNEEWFRTFGGSWNDMGYSVKQTPDGGYIIAGSMRITEEDEQICLIKTDSSGNEEWTQFFGNDIVDDEGHDVILTSDGGYAVTGHFSDLGSGFYKLILIKTDSLGNEQWTYILGSPDYSQSAHSVVQTFDDGYAMTGGNTFYGLSDVFIVRLAPEPVSVSDKSVFIQRGGISFSNPQPNPFNTSTLITFTLPAAEEAALRIFDIGGREVITLARGGLSAGTHYVEWDASAMTSGIYFARLQGGDFTATKKLLLLK